MKVLDGFNVPRCGMSPWNLALLVHDAHGETQDRHDDPDGEREHHQSNQIRLFRVVQDLTSGEVQVDLVLILRDGGGGSADRERQEEEGDHDQGHLLQFFHLLCAYGKDPSKIYIDPPVI